MKIDLDDTLLMISTQLKQFEEMKAIAEQTDSPFMRAEAIGGIIALSEIYSRVTKYATSKQKQWRPTTVNAETIGAREATHNQWAQNGTTK
jgi:hypothetical protein